MLLLEYDWTRKYKQKDIVMKISKILAIGLLASAIGGVTASVIAVESGLPSGMYQDSCDLCKMIDKDTLQCDCTDVNKLKQRTSLNVSQCKSGSIENKNGELSCGLSFEQISVLSMAAATAASALAAAAVNGVRNVVDFLVTLPADAAQQALQLIPVGLRNLVRWEYLRRMRARPLPLEE